LALAVPVGRVSAAGALEGTLLAWEAQGDKWLAEDKSLAEAWKDRSSAEGAAVGKWSAGTSGG
jgi:hypothetical protein